MFSEDAYAKKSLGGMPLQILREKSGNEEAEMLSINYVCSVKVDITSGIAAILFFFVVSVLQLELIPSLSDVNVGAG